MLVHIYQQTQEIFMFRKLEEVKKQKRQRSSSREKQSVQQYSNNRSNIVSHYAPRARGLNIKKPLSSIDLN